MLIRLTSFESKNVEICEKGPVIATQCIFYQEDVIPNVYFFSLDNVYYIIII